MSLLTHRMKTARSDYYGANCQSWFPCEKGSGNLITDKITEATVSDTTAALYTTANAVTLLSTTSGAAANLAKASLKKYGVALMEMKLTTIAALSSVTFGLSSDGNYGILLSASSCMLQVGSIQKAGAPVASAGAVAGDTVVVAAAWDTINLYVYSGKNGDATLELTSALPAGLSTALPRALSPNMSVQITTQAPLYGAALFGFTDGLPTDVLTQINWMRQRWLVGDKVLPASWKDLT